jgi:predicted nucleic acid-binding protein
LIFLLDTTVLIDVLRPRRQRRELLASLVQSGHILATAAINIGELYAGMRTNEVKPAEAFLNELECYPLTASIARRVGELKRDWSTKGKTFSLSDTIVAATALEHDLTLMTDNRKDFFFPGLKLFPMP